jgi:very-short-patch-repair endonuclease
MKSSDLELVMEKHLFFHGIKFEKEFKFHPTRRWRFDFLLEGNIALEVEGATWSGGRHTRGSGFEKDAEKYAHALILGYKVLRVTGTQVMKGIAIEWVLQALGKIPTKGLS